MLCDKVSGGGVSRGLNKHVIIAGSKAKKDYFFFRAVGSLEKRLEIAGIKPRTSRL